MIKWFENMNYESRLEQSMSLETRRLWADLLEVFKILHGLAGLVPDDLFVLRDSGHDTRDHKYMIYNQYYLLTIRKYSFHIQSLMSGTVCMGNMTVKLPRIRPYFHYSVLCY